MLCCAGDDTARDKTKHKRSRKHKKEKKHKKSSEDKELLKAAKKFLKQSEFHSFLSCQFQSIFLVGQQGTGKLTAPLFFLNTELKDGEAGGAARPEEDNEPIEKDTTIDTLTEDDYFRKNAEVHC